MTNSELKSNSVVLFEHLNVWHNFLATQLIANIIFLKVQLFSYLFKMLIHD